MRSKGILTMGTAFPRVPPRNDHCRWSEIADFEPIIACALHSVSGIAGDTLLVG